MTWISAFGPSISTYQIYMNSIFYFRILVIRVMALNLFIYLGFNLAFKTVQVISRWLILLAEKTSTYS